jgi:hypothetical protein
MSARAHATLQVTRAFSVLEHAFGREDIGDVEDEDELVLLLA